MYMVLYGRTSTSSKDLERQLEALRKSLPPTDIVVGSYGDVGSGMAHSRPGLEQVIQAIATGAVDTLCVSSPDRLSRSEEEFDRLESLLRKHGVILRPVRESQDET